MPSPVEDRFLKSPGSGIKVPCRVATTANIALSGLQTVDGIVLVADDRVLVKDQTDATKNGIYAVRETDWERTLDFNDNNDLVNGVTVNVYAGDTQTGLYMVTYAGVLQFGTTEFIFTKVADFSTVVTTPYTQDFLTSTDAADARSKLDVEIGVDVQAYNANIPTTVVSQAEAEAGTSTDNRVWTAERVNQAIQALAPSTGADTDLSNLTAAGNKKIAFAWCNFNGTGTVAIRDEENIASVTDNGTGSYAPVFTNNASNANYSVCANAKENDNSTNDASERIAPLLYSATTSGFTLITSETGSVSVRDCEVIRFQVFGGV